jgi:hypothetical protein
VLFGLCAAVVPLIASGQESIHYASLGGRVTDAQGSPIGGADVTARHTETNVKATAVTDADGRFRFPFLKIGPYELVVAKQGFRPVSRVLAERGSAFSRPSAPPGARRRSWSPAGTRAGNGPQPDRRHRSSPSKRKRCP